VERVLVWGPLPKAGQDIDHVPERVLRLRVVDNTHWTCRYCSVYRTRWTVRSFASSGSALSPEGPSPSHHWRSATGTPPRHRPRLLFAPSRTSSSNSDSLSLFVMCHPFCEQAHRPDQHSTTALGRGRGWRRAEPRSSAGQIDQPAMSTRELETPVTVPTSLSDSARSNNITCSSSPPQLSN